MGIVKICEKWVRFFILCYLELDWIVWPVVCRTWTDQLNENAELKNSVNAQASYTSTKTYLYKQDELDEG
jgi:hypothetical protein